MWKTRNQEFQESMASSFSFLLPLLVLYTFAPAFGGAAIPAGDSTLSAPGPQIRNIIEALIGAGDFGSWANVLFGINPIALSLSTTLFVPGDDALSRLDLRSDFDPFTLAYHIVPHHYSFSDLSRLRAGDRLPTLLRNKTILVTGDSGANFTLDGVPVTAPDLYDRGEVAVHGVGGLLDYSLYGSASAAVPPPPPISTSPANILDAGPHRSAGNRYRGLERRVELLFILVFFCWIVGSSVELVFFIILMLLPLSVCSCSRWKDKR